MLSSFCDGHLRTDTLGDGDIIAETAKLPPRPTLRHDPKTNRSGKCMTP